MTAALLVVSARFDQASKSLVGPFTRLGRPRASYNVMGHGYSDVRRPDPRLAAAIWSALGDAASVVNVGAGTGSYEPDDRDVIAVEPSEVMIAQRPADAAPAVKATAEALPLEDKSVDAALAVLTLAACVDITASLGEHVTNDPFGAAVLAACRLLLRSI
jgi:hypothetical protein